MRVPSLEDRQAGVALVGFFVFCVGLPALAVLGSLLVTGWATALGAHDAHGLGLGWLSDRYPKSHGGYVYEPSTRILLYYLGVITTYIGYQVLEVLAGLFVIFRNALS